MSAKFNGHSIFSLLEEEKAGKKKKRTNSKMKNTHIALRSSACRELTTAASSSGVNTCFIWV